MGQSLKHLSESGLTLSDPDQDVRGAKVLDRAGNHIGEVDELIIDEEHGKVRLLEVGTGGFFGFGEKKLYLPVEAVENVDSEQRVVWIDKDREQMARAPGYDPQLLQGTEWDEVYTYYGYPPYWSPGYRPGRSIFF